MARLTGNSEKTLKQHISTIYEKCGVSSRTEFFHFIFPTWCARPRRRRHLRTYVRFFRRLALL